MIVVMTDTIEIIIGNQLTVIEEEAKIDHKAIKNPINIQETSQVMNQVIMVKNMTNGVEISRDRVPDLGLMTRNILIKL